MTMFNSAAILLITLVAVASGRPSSSLSSRIGDTQIRGRVHTGTDTKLLNLLAKVMEELDEMKDAKVSTDSCSLSDSVITPAQLDDLLNGLIPNTSQYFYIIFNGGDTLSSTNELQLYFSMPHEVKTRINSGNLPTELWLSKVPSSQSIGLLTAAFNQIQKPKIHIESMRYSDTTLEGNVQNFGCLGKLRANFFPVAAWDWTEFISKNKIDNTACTEAITKVTSNSSYTTVRNELNELLDAIGSLQGTSIFSNLCA